MVMRQGIPGCLTIQKYGDVIKHDIAGRAWALWISWWYHQKNSVQMMIPNVGRVPMWPVLSVSHSSFFKNCIRKRPKSLESLGEFTPDTWCIYGTLMDFTMTGWCTMSNHPQIASWGSSLGLQVLLTRQLRQVRGESHPTGRWDFTINTCGYSGDRM
jgi:hypothetical protein